MNAEIKKLLTDIQNSVTMIEQYLQHVSSYTAFKNDVMVMDAVQRRLSIVGEALWKADRLDKALFITDKKRIISFRHILVHDYDLVSDSMIWMICEKHLPVLKREVEEILNSQ